MQPRVTAPGTKYHFDCLRCYCNGCKTCILILFCSLFIFKTSSCDICCLKLVLLPVQWFISPSIPSPYPILVHLHIQYQFVSLSYNSSSPCPILVCVQYPINTYWTKPSPLSKNSMLPRAILGDGEAGPNIARGSILFSIMEEAACK